MYQGVLLVLSAGWDTSDVPALQEDEDKKAERWGKALDSGGVTVFEYRQALGLEADDSHRIYLRSIAKLEVPEGGERPALPPPAKAAGEKARADDARYKRGHAYALQLQRQRTGLEKAFAARLEPMFKGWGRDARAAVLPLLRAHLPKSAKARAGSHDEKADEGLLAAIMSKLGIDAWVAALTQAYAEQYLEVDTAVAEVAERSGLVTNAPDPIGRAIVASGGKRVGLLDLDEQTRAAVFDALAEGRSEGEGIDQLADRIEHLVESGPWLEASTRARIIARTETKYAQNLSTIERAKAAGVQRFVVFDGRLGPGRSDPDHIARDGSIVAAAEADAMIAAEHPNGTLSLAPYFEE